MVHRDKLEKIVPMFKQLWTLLYLSSTLHHALSTVFHQQTHTYIAF